MKEKDTQKIFTEYLAKQNLRMTSQRELILKTLCRQKKHVTAEQLYEQLKKTDKSIGHATVYRTLKLLTEAGIARELNFGEGSIRYEPDTDNTHHDHLVCVQCGENVEFFDEDIEKLQQAVAEKYGYELMDHSMNLYGTCSKCRGKAD
ncbi:ferric uptake regulator, Fur family [Denitrovibrio acetiphilus DSM 12809]|uniref:Ferric uptake regulation protein n=1 Tax=Denitrovibrio acetiphilus (strain DSM 12809 / NBRC 114555 / N2460) TaxID=522772 RepID=D4H712_DENA2|nr:transcriptional repressor [Denitrovibrio acetiphilus]ADD69716.1 ferric uptake regulator, Fur family [Denitrovibrio acetiphilus DSM 12809]